MENQTGSTVLRLLITAIAATVLVSCVDVCEPVDNKLSSDIVFSAQPLNNDYPSVFGIKQDGTELREIIRDGRIFAAPDKNGNFALLRQEGEYDAILIANINGDSIRRVTPRYNKYPIVYSILSPAGNHVLSYNGIDTLRISDNLGTVVTLESLKLNDKWLPAFTSDDKRLAYVVNSDNGPVLSVIENPGQTGSTTLMEKEMGFEPAPDQDYYQLSWDHNGRLLCWISDESMDSYINIIDVDNQNNYWKYLIGGSGVRYAEFSPVDDHLIFSGSGDSLYRMWDYESNLLRRLELTSGEGEITMLPKWSKDGNKAIFIRKQKNSSAASGSLEKIDNVTDPKVLNREPVILFDKVYRAFWNINN